MEHTLLILVQWMIVVEPLVVVWSRRDDSRLVQGLHPIPAPMMIAVDLVGVHQL